MHKFPRGPYLAGREERNWMKGLDAQGHVDNVHQKTEWNNIMLTLRLATQLQETMFVKKRFFDLFLEFLICFQNSSLFFMDFYFWIIWIISRDIVQN